MSTVKKQLTKRPTLRATLLLSVFTSLAAFYVMNFKLSRVTVAGKVVLSYGATQDAKRILGIAIASIPVFVLISVRSNHITITGRSIDTEHGFLVTTTSTVDVTKIKDVEMKRSILDKLLGTASVTVFSSDFTTPELRLTGLSRKDATEVFEAVKANSVNSLVELKLRDRQEKRKS